MFLVISIPKSFDLYRTISGRLADAFESLAMLNAITTSREWYTPTCLVLTFSSLYLTEDVIDTRIHDIFSSMYNSLPDSNVSDLKVNPYPLYRYLNINVSLKSTI